MKLAIGKEIRLLKRWLYETTAEYQKFPYCDQGGEKGLSVCGIKALKRIDPETVFFATYVTLKPVQTLQDRRDFELYMDAHKLAHTHTHKFTLVGIHENMYTIIIFRH